MGRVGHNTVPNYHTVGKAEGDLCNVVLAGSFLPANPLDEARHLCLETSPEKVQQRRNSLAEERTLRKGVLHFVLSSGSRSVMVSYNINSRVSQQGIWEEQVQAEG